MATNCEIIQCTTETPLSLIYADGGVQAGFPSPAQDFMEQALDFNRDMIKNPDAIPNPPNIFSIIPLLLIILYNNQMVCPRAFGGHHQYAKL